MGLAASQARALLIVARKSDIEYRMQCLTQRKMVLAMQTEEIARNYSNKISNRKLKFVHNMNGSNGQPLTEDLSYFSLIQNASFIGNFRVTDSMGRIVIPSYDFMPQQEVEIPVYTKMTTDADGNETASQTQKTDYTAVTTALGESSGTDNNGNKIYPELWLPTNTDEKYVKIQNSDGTLNTDKYVIDANGTRIDIFSKTGSGDDKTTANYSMVDDLKNWNLYKQVVSSSLDKTSDFASAAEAEAAGYKQVNGETTTALVDRQPAADGKYYSDDGREYVVVSAIANTDYFQNALRNGALFLEKENVTELTDALGNKTGKTMSTWSSQAYQSSEVIQDVLYTEDDAQAEAEYETKTAIISAQDKLLDTEIKQLETQHKALETEEDSVKQIIKTNIEKTFAVFKA